MYIYTLFLEILKNNLSRTEKMSLLLSVFMIQTPIPLIGSTLKNRAYYLSYLKNEYTFWKQKSRLKWFSEVDANNYFFHSHCQNRRNHLHISKIKDDFGAILDSQDAINLTQFGFSQLSFPMIPPSV